MSKEIEELQNQLYISDKAHQRVCAENVELEQKIEELQKEVKELLSVVKCPNGNCDNNGTIATQEYPNGEWIPEPCEWCHKRKQLLTK